MKENDINVLENKVYKTTTKDFRTFFNNSITHDKQLRFVFKTLGLPTDEIVSVAPIRTPEVVRFFDTYKLKGKYRVVFWFKSSQALVLRDSEEAKFQPRDPEIYVWIVRDEEGNYDTDFIKIVLGKNAQKDFKDNELTQDELNQVITNALQNISLSEVIEQEEIKEQVRKSIANAVIQQWIRRGTRKDKTQAEVFKQSPAAYFSIKALEVAAANAKELKLSDNYWNSELDPYTPIFSPNTQENAFATGIYNGLIDLLSESADAMSFFFTIFNSATAKNEFVDTISKLLEEETYCSYL